MGVSTDGDISFGMKFDDKDGEFPWDSDPWDGDYEGWWAHFCGFSRGGGVRQYEFLKGTPLPFYPVNYQSQDYPEWILAVPDLGPGAARGYPMSFDPAELVVTNGQAAALGEFIKNHIDVEPDLKWWVSSYWG